MSGSVRLPSRGLLYGDKLPDGEVSIRKLMVSDEVHMQSGAAGPELVARLVATCTKLPVGMTHGELLAADRLAILIGIRVHTFGSKYNYMYACQHCGTANKAECDLSVELKEKQAEDTLVEPIEVHLKDCDKNVSLRFIRGKDEDMICKVSKRTALQSNDVGDPSMITRMALQIVSVDGKPMPDMAERELFARTLTMPDGMDFRDAVDSKEPGIDLTVFPECKHCAGVSEITLPFGLEFFRPARRQP